MNNKPTIVQCGGGWPTNIGNAFVDLGSMYALKKVCEESKILLSSSLPRSFLSRAFLSRDSLSRAFLYFLYSRGYTSAIADNVMNVLDVREVVKADYFVFSGTVLHPSWFARGFPDKLLKKDVKIVINGGGGSSYTRKEIEMVSDYLRKINPYAFISRDEIAFKHYKGIAEHSFNGIDCSFFAKNYFSPVPFDLPRYITLTFDKIDPPEIESKGRMIVRTHHSCWPNTGFWIRRYKCDFNLKNTLISDLPQDYLNLYFNTEETHSDRVHACTVTLAFGKPARLHSHTPRASLLDRIGAGSVKYKLTYPNLEKIEREKEKQLKFLSGILHPR